MKIDNFLTPVLTDALPNSKLPTQNIFNQDNSLWHTDVVVHICVMFNSTFNHQYVDNKTPSYLRTEYMKISIQ